MLHLRVICPTVDTASVNDLLRTEPGIAHVVVTRGISQQPTGDVIEAAVAREVANDVLERLTQLGIARDGEISLYSLDTLVSDTATDVEAEVHGEGTDAVIWDELLSTTGEESELNGIFLAFLTLSCLLAAVGIITDSAITIVGAMVVGPDFGPLAALAVAGVAKRRALAMRAGLALGVGYPVAMLITAALALLARAAGLFDPATLNHLHAAAFIYQIGPYSLIVALLAGAAGMLALTSEKSGVLIGVFISVTTVPAAGFVVLAAVAEHWAQCGEALLQLVINLLGIIVASFITLTIRQSHALSHGGKSTRAH
jgi:uncharacterized hydrophobic protein (TIGR00271 family)